MIATISTALGSLKTALELAKTAVAVRDDNKIAEATQLLNDRIIDVQNAALQLQEKLSTLRDDIEALKDDKRELSAKIAELEQRKAERNQYKLHELSPSVFVLASIETGEGGTPAHYLCQPCMDNKSEKFVLQPRDLWGTRYLACTGCTTEYFVR
ncbi:hypothetical protein FEE59_22165 [Herbaspirillum sp. RU 5E]|nr:hypothetical protein [Herbaspirillum sp. RU 5E]